MPLRARLLAAVPDAPRTLELRAMLLDPASEIIGHAYSAVVCSPDARRLALHGKPAADRVVAALDVAPGAAWSLVSGGRRDEIAPGLRWRRVDLATLARPAALHAAAGEGPAADADPGTGDVGSLADGTGGQPRVGRAIVEPLTADLAADAHAELAGAVDLALAAGGATCALVGGQVAAVAYAAWRTERLFAVAVVTAAEHRRRGLARRTAARLIGAERAARRSPVIAAPEDEPAALGLALSLGFSVVDSIWQGTGSQSPTR